MYMLVITLLADLRTIKNINRNETKTTDIVIIGAGAAGIAAANVLKNANIDFLLLEANDYIGGRMQKHTFGKFVIENGANWIHSPYTDEEPPTNNAFWNYKKLFNMQGNFTNWEDGKHVFKNGTSVHQMLINKWTDRLYESDEFCFHESERLWKRARDEKLTEPGSIDESFKDCFQQYGYFQKDDSSTDKVVGMTLQWYEFDLDATFPPKEVSLMLGIFANKTFVDFVDEDFLITDQRGYSFILEELAADFLPSILLNQRVLGINHNNHGVSILAENRNNDLSQWNLLEVRAKYVICTVPLGVLQSETIAFSTPLSPAKMAGINGMNMGFYAKLYLRFPVNFWGDKETLLVVGQPIGSYTWALNLDHPKYLPGSKMLTFHFVGDFARKIETQDISTTQAEAMKNLRNLFGNSIPHPVAIHVTNWSHNPFSYGSYSSFPMGYTHRLWEDMRKREGQLFFAGEHTVSDLLIGLAHGAFKSGEEIANKIISLHPAGPSTPTSKQHINAAQPIYTFSFHYAYAFILFIPYFV